MRCLERFVLLLVSGPLCLLTACSSAEPQSEPVESNGIYVTINGELLAGWMNVDVFHVPKGLRVMVEEDFSVHATKYICIEGDIMLRDRTLGDPRTDAPNLRLACDEEILVTGRIIGGAGRSFGGVPPENCVGQPGGDGSSIELSAPRYLMLGALVAGRGGRGGAGSDGGAGGAIVVTGDLVSPGQYVFIEQSRVKQLATSDAGFYGGAGGGAGGPWNGVPGSPGKSGGMTSMPWSGPESPE
jgi:hypothetical protein